MKPDVTEEIIWSLLEEVHDPEVPVLSVLDLGVVRNVEVHQNADGTPQIKITITPTYSGCPAMDAISMDIRLKLLEKGYRNIHIQQQLSPAWTTDWMTEAGKEKLKAYGIAPPQYQKKATGLFEEPEVTCPRCGSTHTDLISQFASTACKSMHRCLDCKEAFDYFKCH